MYLVLSCDHLETKFYKHPLFQPKLINKIKLVLEIVLLLYLDLGHEDSRLKV